MVSDGMAQNHCRLPWLANMSKIKEIVQHIQGVIVHGRKTILYRTFHNVGKGANLQIHTMLLSIENIRRSSLGHLPETFFIQIDGGSENIARVNYFLAELMVARRLFKRVVVSRLMVGHTHCDVDADFGRIWIKIRVLL